MSLSPNKVRRWFSQGFAAHARGQLQLALSFYTKILERAPMHPAALHQASIVSNQLRLVARHNAKRTPEELAELEDTTMRLMSLAIAAYPHNAAAIHNFAKLKHDRGDLEDSRDLYRHAVAIKPTQGESWVNLGNCLMDLGDRANGEAAWNRAAALPAVSADGKFNLAFLKLLRGEYAEGWALYEERWNCPEFLHGYGRYEIKAPMWDGGALAGRSIYVHGEQGNGDAIQFGRYIPLIETQGADVTIEVQEPLVRLFQETFPHLPVQALGTPVPATDVHIPMMSLPNRFGTTVDAVPAPLPVPAIPSSSAAIDQLMETLTRTPGLRVGIAWAGSSAHPNDRQRSMPDDVLSELRGIDGVTFVNLQVGPRAGGFAALRGIDATPAIASFADTAALLPFLDLVLTVDSALAHLAPSAGRPTWVLLPYGAEWRWLQDRLDTPWYPTARLWRQQEARDWRSVLARVRAELLTLTPAPTALKAA